MEYAGIALIPLIVGISEVLKTLGLNTKFIPLINLIIGIIMGIIVFSDDIKLGVVKGIYLGLSSAGLFSSGKHFINDFIVKKKDNEK